MVVLVMDCDIDENAGPSAGRSKYSRSISTGFSRGTSNSRKRSYDRSRSCIQRDKAPYNRQRADVVASNHGLLYNIENQVRLDAEVPFIDPYGGGSDNEQYDNVDTVVGEEFNFGKLSSFWPVR